MVYLPNISPWLLDARRSTASYDSIALGCCLTQRFVLWSFSLEKIALVLFNFKISVGQINPCLFPHHEMHKVIKVCKFQATLFLHTLVVLKFVIE